LDIEVEPYSSSFFESASRTSGLEVDDLDEQSEEEPWLKNPVMRVSEVTFTATL
jgi:hypothetical protein